MLRIGVSIPVDLHVNQWLQHVKVCHFTVSSRAPLSRPGSINLEIQYG